MAEQQAGVWAVIAVLRPTDGSDPVRFYWATRDFTSGNETQEAAQETPPGVPPVFDQSFDGIVDRGLALTRSILGGSALFSRRSTIDAGSLVLSRSIGKKQILPTDIVSDYNWRDSVVHFYYAPGNPALFSDFSLRRSLRFSSEPSVTKRDDTISIALGTGDFLFGRDLQEDFRTARSLTSASPRITSNRYRGYGYCVRGDYPNTMYGRAASAAVAAAHPNFYIVGDFTVLWRVRWGDSSGATTSDGDIFGRGAATPASQSEARLSLHMSYDGKSVSLIWSTAAAPGTLKTLTWSSAVEDHHKEDNEQTGENQWHDFAISVDVSARTARLIRDGEFISQQTWVAGDDPYTDGFGWDCGSYLLRRAEGATTYWDNGDLDEVYVIRRALTDAEVADLQGAGPSDGSDDDAAFLIGFDEGFGLDWYDGVASAKTLNGVFVEDSASSYIEVADDADIEPTNNSYRVRATFATQEVDRAASADVYLKNLVYELRLNTDNKLYGRMGTGAAWMTEVASTTLVSPGVIYTVDLTYDGGTLRLYVNGVEEDSNAETATLGGNANNLYLGGSGTGNGEGMWIFDFGTFTGRGTDRAVRSQWERLLTGGETDAQSYFPFTEGTGNATDLVSDPGLTATVSGATWVEAKVEVQNPWEGMWQPTGEGTRDLTGVYKPEAWGRVRGKRLETVDPLNGILQVHKREVERVSRVTDGGDELTKTEDSSDLANSVPELSGHAIPGTVSVTASTAAVTGTGTLFLEWLRPGMKVRLGSEDHVVQSVSSDSAFTLGKNHTAGASSVSLYRAQPRPGFYRTDLSRGLIQVGQSTPNHGYEVDLWGDVHPVLGYTEDLVELFERLAGRVAPVVPFMLNAYIDYGAVFNKTSESFSWGQWFVRDPLPGRSVSSPKERGLFGRYNQYDLYMDGDRASADYGKMVAKIDDGTTTHTATSINRIDDGDLHLAWAAVDRVNDELRLYIDGTIQETVDITGLGNLSGTENLRSGGDQPNLRPWGTGVGYSDGEAWMGPAFIADGVTGLEQVWNLARVGLPPTDGTARTSASSYWSYEEGAGVTVESENTVGTTAYVSSVRWRDAMMGSPRVESSAVSAPWAGQLWTGREGVAAAEWADLLAAAWKGWWGVSKEGLFKVGEFDPAAASARTISHDDVLTEEVSSKIALVPTGDLSVGYARREAVFGPGQIHGDLDSETLAKMLDRLDSEYTFFEADAQGMVPAAARYPEVVAREILTAAARRNGAKQIWVWHRDYFNVKSWLVQVPIRWLASQDDDLGDVVTFDGAPLVTAGEGEATKTAVIVEIRDDPARFRSTLTVWVSEIFA